MPLWSHVTASDHLRRRAEDLIKVARKGERDSTGVYGQSAKGAERRATFSDDQRYSHDPEAIYGYGRKYS